MPAEGIELLKHQDILSFEEILDVIKYGVTQGINKVRITGGEPLVRKGIVNFISDISKIEGITDLTMTTNGTLLDQFASDLKKAGLMRVNISMDTVDPDKYTQITRGGDLRKVVSGIVAAQKAGLLPVKINCVVHENSEEEDALGVREFCRLMGLEIRYIHLMDLEKGKFSVVEGGEGGNCKSCNRLRLTSNGKLMPCLFSDLSYDIRELGINEAFRLATENKPESGSCSLEHRFYNIGG
jgi:cyclic pyranopterin phosphate synthase